MLTLLDERIEGIVRERILISYLRYKVIIVCVCVCVCVCLDESVVSLLMVVGTWFRVKRKHLCSMKCAACAASMIARQVDHSLVVYD
jgi:hypothetical protein